MVLTFVQRPKEQSLKTRNTEVTAVREAGKEASNTQATFWGLRRIALTVNVHMFKPLSRLNCT